MNPERAKKGYTRYELVSVIIIVAVVIAIAVPLVLNFVENDRRGLDGLAAERAESAALIEFMQNHSTGGEAIVYMFSGDTEVINVYRHWAYEGESYSAITPPRHDGYNDTPTIGGGTPKRGKSKRIGDRALYVVVSPEGDVIYNSWRTLK